MTTQKQKLEITNFSKEQFVDAIEAAEILNISVKTLYTHTSQKKIPCFRPTRGKLMFLKSDLIDFITNSNTSKTN